MRNGPGDAERTGTFPVIDGVDVAAALEEGLADTAVCTGGLQAASSRVTATPTTDRRLTPPLIDEVERMARTTVDRAATLRSPPGR
jgi:hypothetical protein